MTDAGKAVFLLTRDGIAKRIGTEHECWMYLHRVHSFSVAHALEYEGY